MLDGRAPPQRVPNERPGSAVNFEVKLKAADDDGLVRMRTSHLGGLMLMLGLGVALFFMPRDHWALADTSILVGVCIGLLYFFSRLFRIAQESKRRSSDS